MCNRLFVAGFGGIGDAVVCTKCGIDKYPEAIPFAYGLAKILGRVIEEDDPKHAMLAEEARAARHARAILEGANT